MKSRFRNILSGCLLAALGGLIPHEALACAPYFQPSYIKNKSPYKTVLHRELAVKRLIADLEDLIPVVPEIPDGVPWETAVRQDFTEAVNRRLPHLAPEEKQKLIDEYLLFVLDARKNEDPSMENFPDLPEELTEFRLYRAGVAEMIPDGKEIPPSWKKLLELPPESRHYRTVWVHYMLGNYLTHDCGKYYQACRTAAREGFADTHGLVKASYKSEFRYSTDPVRRIHAALEAQRNRPDMKLLSKAYRVTRVPFHDTWVDRHTLIPESDAECIAMLEDPLCREVLAVFGCDRKIFQQEVWKYKFRNADVMAWRAYEAGDVETAEKYLKLRTRDTLLSTYIEAKIARYRGDSELAVRKLRQWLKFVEEIDSNDLPDVIEMKYVWTDPYDHEPSYPLKEDVYGQLGSALVHRRDFTEAAMFFYKARQGVDVKYIGERLMTLSELTAFVDSLDEDLKSGVEEEQDYVKWIRYMTARRAVREGQFDIARKYMPDKYKGILDNYLAFIRSGNDVSRSGDERAMSLYSAAKFMRWYGMELCGTQGEPDNYSYGGSYGLDAEIEDCPNCKYGPETDCWTAICTNHQSPYGHYLQEDKTEHDYTPVRGRPPAPRNQRFHYRYRAAELARQAADLAQDEDLRALANLFGGECLRIRTPRRADVFYKRLVKQSPHSAIAKIADKLRWFPDCPALKGELNSITPCKSLDEVKTLFQTASAELKDVVEEKEELRRQKKEAARQKKILARFIPMVLLNDLKGAEECFAQGVDLNAEDDRGLVALHYAAAYHHLEMIRWLLAHGADVNRRNKRSMTPLHFALGGGDMHRETDPEKTLEAVKLLVEAKAKVNERDDYGATPIYLAVGDLNILKYLAEHGGYLESGNAYGGQTPLHWAISKNVPLKNIEFLVEHGAKLDAMDDGGYTALHRAVLGKKADVVKYLAEHDANLNLVMEKDWKTALDLAEENHLSEIAGYLKSRGAVSGKSVKTPHRLSKHLLSAVIAGDRKRAMECISLGGDINEEDEGGLRPLHHAVLSQDLKMIGFLLELGADVNLPSRSLKAPPLHYAVTGNDRGNLQIVKYLVEHGADVNLRDKEGKTALDLAEEKDLHEIAGYLKDHGAEESRK